MAIYEYKAKNKEGQIRSAVQEAKSEKELVKYLNLKGLVVSEIKEIGSGKGPTSKGSMSFYDLLGKVSLVEKMMFTRNLAVMVESGLSLSEALDALSEQSKSAKLRKAITEIAQRIKAGESFSDALAKYPKVFNELYVNMVKVGESGGSLESVLKMLAEHMKRDHEIVSRVKGAMIYPGVIFTAMVGIGILMMIVVVPKLSEVFRQLDTELPPQTQFLINLSDFLASNIILVLILIFGLVVGIKFFSKTALGKKIFHALFLKMPLIGPIVQKVNSARFATTFSSLSDSGLAMVDSLKIVAGTLGNVYFKESLIEAVAKIQKGEPLSKSLLSSKNAHKIYPPMIIQMISVGEKTGSLSDVLKNLASFYEEEVNNVTKSLSSVIEPILMLFIGAAVAFFAISMLQPMYSMMESL